MLPRTPALSSIARRSKTARLDSEHGELIDSRGLQVAPLRYPQLDYQESFDSVEAFYRQFYFRASKIASIVSEMARSREMLFRRLREEVEFMSFLRERRGLTT